MAQVNSFSATPAYEQLRLASKILNCAQQGLNVLSPICLLVQNTLSACYNSKLSTEMTCKSEKGPYNLYKSTQGEKLLPPLSIEVTETRLRVIVRELPWENKCHIQQILRVTLYYHNAN